MHGHETWRLAASLAHAAALALLAIVGLHRAGLVLLLAMRRRAASPAALDEPPRVTVQVPVFDEALVIGRTLDAVGALRWPRDHLEVQVLDDSADETTAIVGRKCEELRALGVAAHHVRRAGRDGFKAGALAHGLETATGEVVLVLDADFAPPPELLERATPPFADPRVGLVQVRWEHANRGRSLLTRVQALLLDAHFAVEQAGRSRAGLPVKFNGTAGLWRRAAIDDAGGWSADTLTEDLDLSLRARLRGWRLAFLEEVAVAGELPDEVLAVRSQQRRWVRGSGQCLRKLAGIVLRAPIGAGARLDALASLAGNSGYPLALLVAALSVPVVALGRPRHPALLGPLGSGLFLVATLGIAAYLLASQRRRGLRGLAEGALLLPFAFALGLGLSAANARAFLAGLLLLGRTPFVRTPKRGDEPARYRAPIPWLEIGVELLLATAFAWGLATALASRRPHLTAPFQAVLLLSFGAVGLFSLTAGIKTRFGRDEIAHPPSKPTGSATRTLVRRWAPGP